MTTSHAASESADAPDSAWFRELAEAAGDFFFRLRLSPTRAFEFVGGQVEELFGVTTAEVLADVDAVERAIDPDDLPMVNRVFSRTGEGDVDTELRWRRSDGSHVVARVWARRRVRADGSMVLEGIGRDVTALRTAQAAVESERRLYKTITETMAEAVSIIDVETLAVVYVSPSVETLTGFTVEEVTAAPLDSQFVPSADCDYATRIAYGADRVTDGTRPADEFTILQVPYRHRDGRVIWLEVASRYHRDEASGRVQLWSVARDVTARELARQELAESERRYRLLAENASDVVLLRDRDGIISWVSPSTPTALGWTESDMLGHDTIEFVHREDVPSIRALRADVNTGRARSGVVRARHRDGSFRYMSVVSRAVRGHDGALTGAVVSLRDIDDVVRERERAEHDHAVLRAQADARLTPQALFRAVRGDDGRITDFALVNANQAAMTSLNIDPEAGPAGRTLLSEAPMLSGSPLFEQLRQVVDHGRPLLVNDVAVESRWTEGPRRLDVSAAKVDDGFTIDWIDVTHRYEAAQRLADSERRYRLLAESTMDVIVHYRDATVAWVSPALTEALGWVPAEWLGRSIAEFLHPDDREAHDRNARTLLSGKPVVARYRLRSRDSAYHWVETRAKPFRDETGAPDGVVASFRTIDLEVRAEEELERRARYDDLTGLLKRNEVLQRLSIPDGRREPGARRAVAFVDVDGLKEINDTLGHRAGDAALRTLAGRFTDAVRDGDSVARMGGDEFLVLLEGVHDETEALEVAEKIRKVAEAPVVVGGHLLRTTVSIGVALARPGETADDVVARADRAMYTAKQTGRNRVHSLDRPASDGAAPAGSYASE